MLALLGILAFLTGIMLSVVYSCWGWFIAGAVILGGSTIFYLLGSVAWNQAGVIAKHGGNGKWWKANRERVINTALIMAIFAVGGVTLYYVAKRIAAHFPCSDGCVAAAPAPACSTHCGGTTTATSAAVVTATDTVAKTTLLTKSDSATAVMHPYEQDFWWGDDARIDTYAVRRGADLVRVFRLKPGLDTATVVVQIQPCSYPRHPCV